MADKADACSQTTLFARNLPLNVTTQKLEEIFSNIGPLKRCFVITERGDKSKSKGFAYITFMSKNDAELAIKKVSNINGTRIFLKFANRRNVPQNEKTEVKIKEKDNKPKKSRNARLIIRNLSFKATEVDIKKLFSKFGKLSEVTIPKKRDGKMIGCCFVQYFDIKSAHAALTAMNSQKILGRPVAVDWSLPKDKYIQLTKKNVDDKSEIDDNESMTKKDGDEDTETDDEESEAGDDDSGINDEIDQNSLRKRKKFDIEESDSEGSESEVDEDTDEEEDGGSDSDEMESGDEDDDDEDEDDDDEDEDDDDDDEFNSKRKLSNDVNEGKTLFIRNITFDTTDEDLKTTFNQFGKVIYGKICIDPDTEHSKGSGFVKFETKESAEACLDKANEESEEGGIFIDGKKLNICLAMSRQEIIKRHEEAHKKQPSDSRHLYLAREGLIRPGTKAAEGVSQSDMNKRSKLEVWKQQMLKSLNIFISLNRLCVRNIPDSMTEGTLKKIFLKAAGNKAKITEARIIRYRTKTGANNVGDSKGYGFVTFTTHEDALKALRLTNNNPRIFSKAQRPIVEFSLEKKGAVKAKEKRLEQSRKKLKLEKEANGFSHSKNSKNIKKKDSTDEGGDNMREEIFMGAKGRPGSKRVLPSKRLKVKKLNVKKMKGKKVSRKVKRMKK